MKRINLITLSVSIMSLVLLGCPTPSDNDAVGILSIWDGKLNANLQIGKIATVATATSSAKKIGGKDSLEANYQADSGSGIFLTNKAGAGRKGINLIKYKDGLLEFTIDHSAITNLDELEIMMTSKDGSSAEKGEKLNLFDIDATTKNGTVHTYKIPLGSFDSKSLLEFDKMTRYFSMANPKVSNAVGKGKIYVGDIKIKPKNDLTLTSLKFTTVADSTVALSVGGTKNLSDVRKVYSNKATVKVASVKWSTSDKTKATVSDKGVITAVASGEATITGIVGGKKITSTVTIS